MRRTDQQGEGSISALLLVQREEANVHQLQDRRHRQETPGVDLAWAPGGEGGVVGYYWQGRFRAGKGRQGRSFEEGQGAYTFEGRWQEEGRRRSVEAGAN